jgi:hypothetical protein
VKEKIFGNSVDVVDVADVVVVVVNRVDVADVGVDVAANDGLLICVVQHAI